MNEDKMTRECTASVLLYGAEFDANDEFALGRNVLEDVRLEPTQQVTAEQLMKPLDLLLLRDVRKLLQEQLQVAARQPQNILINLTYY